MSSNMFMLPVQSQISASGLNGSDTRAPAASKAGPPGESSDPGRSFSATLNRVSGRQHGSNQKTTPSGKPAAAYRDSNTDSASSPKMSKTTGCPHDPTKEVVTSLSKASVPLIFALPGSGLKSFHPADFATVEEGSSAVEAQSDSAMTPAFLMLTDLIGYLHQQQPIAGAPLSIGPFEQLQTGISPEAINRAFFEQLASGTVPPGNGEGGVGKAARFFEFWQWMLSQPSTAPDGAIIGQPAASGIDGNAPFNPLLHLAGMRAAGPEALHSNAELLLKMATPSEPVQTEISENAKMAVDGQAKSLSFSAAGDAISENLLEAQTRPMRESSQRLAVQTAIKADVEQPASPNSAGEGVTAGRLEALFDIKSAVQKSEVPAVDTPGDKISRIDGESKDSGLLFSQDQMPPNLSRLENGAQSTEAARRGLMSQALNQIVQKAVLSLHNGQHEVQLHLKPDYLGHIRMQIVSEGQQVTIKFAAEFPFVKDMLENNLHQLRADLQAQGLNVDALEVSVAHDSHAEGGLHRNAEAKRLQAIKDETDCDDGSAEISAQTQSRNGGAMAQTAIDYFA